MGSSESKSTNNSEKEIASSAKNTPSTPIQCAKTKITKNFSTEDPRSPSENIIRTPIEITTHSPLETVNPQTPIFLKAVDPRSPTDQFHRTPIIIPVTNSELPQKLHNKILDKARRSIDYTPTAHIRKNIPKKYAITPPKLLDSSPISKKNERRKSCVGLLETNIDYTETDLDNYAKTKSFQSNLTINIENDMTRGDILKCENCDPRSPTTDFLRTPIEIVKKIGEIDLNKIESVDDEVSSNIGSLLKIVDSPICEENSPNNSKEIGIEDSENNKTEENVQISQDSPSRVVMQEIVQDLLNAVENIVINEKIEEQIDLTVEVQEFDRKLTQIIHEDDISAFRMTPKRNVDESGRRRTPMKDRNLIEPKRNKLRVSDKPRKSDYGVSKIPVFRDSKKLKEDCENTPPTADVRRKRKGHPKWDSDKTLVI